MFLSAANLRDKVPQKIIAFTVENSRAHHLLPVEDSFKINNTKTLKIITVADGITRDPIGVPHLPSPHQLLAEIEFVEKYPRPSPAKITADTFCKSFISYLKKQKNGSVEMISNAFSLANLKIKNLNKKKNPHPDYLERDLWGCVASAGFIQKDKLYYGYICDCGVCIFDKKGRLKFRTTNDKDEADKLLDFRGKDWRNPKWRADRRKEYRNNPNKKVRGKLASYGALTGEKNALFFVKTGKQKLCTGDHIFFYSDGMEKILFSTEFQKILATTEWDKLEESCRKLHHTKEGAEATLVGIKF